MDKVFAEMKHLARYYRYNIVIGLAMIGLVKYIAYCIKLRACKKYSTMRTPIFVS